MNPRAQADYDNAEPPDSWGLCPRCHDTAIPEEADYCAPCKEIVERAYAEQMASAIHATGTPCPTKRACGCLLTDEEVAAFPEIGRQETPADWSECDCDWNLREWNPELRHAKDCAGRGYTLILVNCPTCHSTIERKP